MGVRAILATIVVTVCLASAPVAWAVPTSPASTQPATDPAAGYRLGLGPHPTTSVDLELADKTTGRKLPLKVRYAADAAGPLTGGRLLPRRRR